MRKLVDDGLKIKGAKRLSFSLPVVANYFIVGEAREVHICII
jgi:hypothetical protein